MRVTVATIMDQIAEGASIDDVLAEYPYLEREDVQQNPVLRVVAHQGRGDPA
jgi:uncharacterized protein (DUF433 family)